MNAERSGRANEQDIHDSRDDMRRTVLQGVIDQMEIELLRMPDTEREEREQEG